VGNPINYLIVAAIIYQSIVEQGGADFEVNPGKDAG
jgi:hypothetical protein